MSRRGYRTGLDSARFRRGHAHPAVVRQLGLSLGEVLDVGVVAIGEQYYEWRPVEHCPICRLTHVAGDCGRGAP